MDDVTVNLNTESSTVINFASEEFIEISASQTVHENIENEVETINSFRGGSINNLTNYIPFKGRYVLKVIDADTMMCEIIDNIKVIIFIMKMIKCLSSFN